tara:strand:- start:7766 stop:8329 length:564 start_codon:yes stop_codon:yes gene_type:complete
MKKVILTLESAAPLTQSRKHNTEFEDGEKHDAYEKRTWRNKAHQDEGGNIYIPGISLKFALDAAAKGKGLKIKGKGQRTYTKLFVSGIIVEHIIPTGKTVDDLKQQWFLANADGVRGSGKRVDRCVPRLDSWAGQVTVYVANDEIENNIFEDHIDYAGKFVGMGQYRPENGGCNGRFDVINAEWSKA